MKYTAEKAVISDMAPLVREQHTVILSYFGGKGCVAFFAQVCANMRRSYTSGNAIINISYTSGSAIMNISVFAAGWHSCTDTLGTYMCSDHSTLPTIYRGLWAYPLNEAQLLNNCDR